MLQDRSGIEVLKTVIARDPRESSKIEAITQLGWRASGAGSSKFGQEALLEIDAKALSPLAFAAWVRALGYAAEDTGGSAHDRRYFDKVQTIVLEAVKSDAPSTQKAAVKALVGLLSFHAVTGPQREAVLYLAKKGSLEAQGELAWELGSLVSHFMDRKMSLKEKAWLTEVLTALTQSPDSRAKFWATSSLGRMKK
ncbi:hypothetical protein WDW86_05895 [Bdellovibrionota bacterium FG-2]